jgi:hypothetical protein
MVEIKYGDQFEVSDLAGQTVCEARGQFKSDFGIPDKAAARLNGSKVKSSAELDTVLNDDDKLTFAVARSRTPFLVGALLLALAVTGGVFAFGFINASTTLTATLANSNFADVSVNGTLGGQYGVGNVTWSGFGYFKGNIEGPQSVFNVQPAPGYTGDLVTTVTIGNAADLARRYRVLALQLEMVYTNNGSIEINEDSLGNNNWTVLTLDNGSVSMFTRYSDTAGANMTVRIKKGFYITHVYPEAGWKGSAIPELFCEVAQR